MKIRPVLSASLLAFTLSCLAAEPNPFVTTEAKKLPSAVSGDSFVTLTEHLLVPADQLDAWLEKHPLTDDVSNLRKVTQTWIAEGTAWLDHTAVSTGTAGREYTNDSIWEQTYATEYRSLEPSEWPIPTAFETRNLGYNVSGSAGIEQGAMLLRAKMEFCGMMLPHHAWNELAERTRQPDDVFIPRFRAITAERVSLDANGNQTQADPFAEPTKNPAGLKDLRFEPGKVYLASRADDDLPEPAANRPPDVEVKPAPRNSHRLVRLIFFRGTLLENPTVTPATTTDIHHFSTKLVRVDHKTFSDWVQTNELSKIPDLAWSAAGDWQKNGVAETTMDLIAPNHTGSTCNVETRQEVIYPTDWEPGKLLPAPDGKPTQREFSNASAFEKRNVGTQLQAEVVSDPKGAILKFGLTRLAEGGKSVHHRIFRDGKWKVDITSPIFSNNTWNSELRVKQGEWMLVGSGSDIDAKGKLDPTRSVLAFIKLD